MPALQLTVWRCRRWQRAVAALAALALAGLAAWITAAPRYAPLALLLGVATLASAVMAARIEPLQLRFDGLSWHWQPLRAARAAGGCGRVRVALDLGDWLLLRLEPAPGGGRARWLPVEAAAAPALWHTLRCAVYCRTPGDDPLAVSNSPDA